ncbi:hypothetical protein ACIBI9_00635 [Nonomuraea sp. NPDC050451]|uniref:hypothetical protein n=1 Tax=Nonomuraea sp. NPDC050451 TaxID=3364364 RepID=UPI0037B1A39B
MRRWFEQLASYLAIKRGLGDVLTAATHDAVTNETYGPVIGAIAVILPAGEAAGTTARSRSRRRAADDGLRVAGAARPGR